MPCPTKSVRIPNWKADARGVQRGLTELQTASRYRIESDSEMPCLPGEGKGTRCYTKHSGTRKTCRILLQANEAAMQLPPGLYIWGISSVFDARVLRCDAFDPIMYEHTTVDTSHADTTPVRGDVLSLGPYVNEEGLVQMKCVHKSVFMSSPLMDVESFGSAWMDSTLTDFYVPGLDMLRKAYNEYLAAGLTPPPSFRTMHDTQGGYYKERAALAKYTSTRPDSLKRVRLLCRLFFHFAMYLRRWAGPGRPYPITEGRSHTKVGRPSNPVSESIRDRMVTANGAVRLVTRGAHPSADTINEEGRLANMEVAHMQAIRTVFDSMSEHEQKLVRYALRGGTRFSMADGWGYYMDAESLLDVCFGSVYSVAGGDRCVRLASKTILTSILTIVKHIYKTPPTWTRYEGTLDHVH